MDGYYDILYYITMQYLIIDINAQFNNIIVVDQNRNGETCRRRAAKR